MPPSQRAQLLGWYLALLGPTLYVKYRFMMTLSRWWVAGASPSHVSDGAIPSVWQLWFLHVAPTDVIEVAGFVAVVWLIGHVLLRVPVKWLAMGSVAFATAYLGLTLVALRETNALLTLEAIRMTINWLSHDPKVLMQALTPRQMLLAVAGACWIASPIVLTRVIAYVSRGAPWRRLAPISLAAALVVAALVARPDAFNPPSSSISLSRGLWTSAALTLTREWTDAPRPGNRAVSALLDDYLRLVYPAGRPETAAPLVEIPADQRRPRHVLFVLLETAPREFYALIDNPALPVIQAMSQHAIVSDHHYAAAPTTDLAVHAIFSGTYPRPGHPIYRFGRFTTDGLATTLRARGYRSTFIDSITLKWNLAQEADAVGDLGFSTVLEMSDAPLPPIADAYEYGIARERKSLSMALEAIADAERQQQKAIVAVATNVGHFPWRAPAGSAALSSKERVAGLARLVDGLLGEVLASLATQGLADDTIIVVVGDHGLRFALEFDSFGEPIRHGDLMFNVPLLVYAPALFSSQIRLPWVTSHVDLAPTLLDLLGVPRAGLLLHGENLLDGRLRDRVTLLPSGMFAPMYPVDGFHYRGDAYTWAYVIDRVNVRHDAGTATADRPFLTLDQARELLRSSRPLLDETAAAFLRRGAGAAVSGAATPGASR